MDRVKICLEKPLHKSSRTYVETTKFCRIKGCGGIFEIFERLKLPKQIIYLRKENLSESPNHLKYQENDLISRFYEHFSRNSRNLGHFGSSKKFQTLRI